MVTNPQHSHMTVEEYLELDRNSPDVRYEYIDGQVRMMSGGTADHATIAGNIFSILRASLRSTSCRVYNSDMRVRVAKTRYVYPDVSVSCDERDRGEIDILQSPTFVVEVLSPSTEGYDRGEKSWYYREHPTIQEYMLVNTKCPIIEILRRGQGDSWFVSVLGLNDEVQLSSLEVNFPVKDVYENIVFPEMIWKKYGSSVEEYLQLDNRYDVRFEYSDGLISLRDGTPVVLLGGIGPDEPSAENAMVVIADTTEEEVKQLAAFVASLRSR